MVNPNANPESTHDRQNGQYPPHTNPDQLEHQNKMREN